MKNLKKLLPVFALVLGLGLVFTQSAFKAKTGDMYGKTYSGSDVIWIPLTELTEDNESEELPLGTYRCEFDEEEICTAEFATPPAVNAIPSAGTVPGIFNYNP